MFEELIKKRPFPRNATKRFEGLEHDKHLCPVFEERIASILEAYKAYGTECHDVQGMRDDGVDVLLKYYDPDEQRHQIGLQIKSFREIEDWKLKKVKDGGLLSKLKSQYATAIGNVKVERYYIILCADAVRHEKQVRMVASEFKQFSDVTVISPGQALSFFEMSPIEVEMSTIRELCKEDTVLTEAQKEMDRQSGIYAYVLLHLLCRFYGGNDEISNNDLSANLEDWNERGGEDDSDDLANAIGEMENAGILTYGGYHYSINSTAFPLSLSALYFDVRFRRSVAASAAFEHMFQLLDLAQYAGGE